MSASTEFGRLAELAAQVTDPARAELVEWQIATALASLPERDPVVDVATSRLISTATDLSRPLSRRVAALAHLHRAPVP